MKVKRLSKTGRVLVELKGTDDQLLAKGTGGAKSSFRLKKILVPTDFSTCSEKALQYAIALARQFSAKVALLHVVQPAYGSGELSLMTPVFPEGEIRRECETRLSAIIRSDVKGQVPTAAFVRVGRPVTEIIEAAREQKADLIVIATHGHTGLKHVLLGSVAENVVRHARCPVLVVREREHEFITS